MFHTDLKLLWNGAIFVLSLISKNSRYRLKNEDLILFILNYFIQIFLVISKMETARELTKQKYLLTIHGHAKRKCKLRNTLRQGEIVAVQEGQSRWAGMWVEWVPVCAWTAADQPAVIHQAVLLRGHSRPGAVSFWPQGCQEHSKYRLEVDDEGK